MTIYKLDYVFLLQSIKSVNLSMSANHPLYDCFQIILKKVPEDQRDFLTNNRSNLRNHTVPPSIDILTRLHKQVIYELYFFHVN